jgi:hypothetical protein
MFNPGSKVVGMNHMVVSFEELQLLPKDLRTEQISVENNFRNGMIGGNDSMVIHDRIAAGRHYVIEPSDLMQSRIYRVLQEWTNQPHARPQDSIMQPPSFLSLQPGFA